MLDIFNSEFVTVTVNLIVIIGFLLVVYFVMSKFLPTLSGEKLKEQIRTSTTSQNVFAFLSVVVASTFLDLFTNQKFYMLWMVIIISILTILFNILYEKVVNKNQEIDSKESYKIGLSLLEQIINCKGYSLIKNANDIEKIENNADEIYIFCDSLITDLNIDTNNEENAGLFFNIVAHNIPKGKKYIYFLKDTKENREYFIQYNEQHFNESNQEFVQNISFYFVSEDDFYFYSEIYLYKNNIDKDIAFEWIPSLGEKGDEKKQFYLQLSSKQAQNINEIICELMISYPRQALEGVK